MALESAEIKFDYRTYNYYGQHQLKDFHLVPSAPLKDLPRPTTIYHCNDTRQLEYLPLWPSIDTRQLKAIPLWPSRDTRQLKDLPLWPSQPGFFGRIVDYLASFF